MIGAPIWFDFDNVVDENFRKDKLYSPYVKGLVNKSIKGQSALVIMFGPSEEHRSGLLKYTNSKEKGMLGRAIEDILVFRDMYGYNKLSIVLNAYQIYLEGIEDLISNSRGVKLTSHKMPQMITSLDSITGQNFDQIVTLNCKNLTKSKDIISVVQEISKNREKLAKNMYAISADEMKRRSHLVVTLNLYSDYGKPGEEKVSDLTFIELCGSEQATTGMISSMNKSMTDKEFASKSFNSLSYEITNTNAKQGKAKKNDETSTIVSKLWAKYIRNSSMNTMFVWKVSPDGARFKHSLTAIKFVAKLQEVIRKRVKLVLPEEPKQAPETFRTMSSRNSTYEYASDHKQLPDKLLKSSIKSETLSHYITETDQSQFKSNEILNYLITDLDDFLHKSEDNMYHTGSDKEEWFEECQEKIVHIEDIIKRLPEDTKTEFMQSEISLRLKYLMDLVRSKRKEYMMTLCNNEPGMFDHNSGPKSKASTHRSSKKQDLFETNDEMLRQSKENDLLLINSTGIPKSTLEGSLQKPLSSFSDNFENQAPNRYHENRSNSQSHSASSKQHANVSFQNDKIKELEERYKELDERTVSFIRLYNYQML